jgi:hypothetical protein
MATNNPESFGKTNLVGKLKGPLLMGQTTFR